MLDTYIHDRDNCGCFVTTHATRTNLLTARLLTQYYLRGGYSSSYNREPPFGSSSRAKWNSLYFTLLPFISWCPTMVSFVVRYPSVLPLTNPVTIVMCCPAMLLSTNYVASPRCAVASQSRHFAVSSLRVVCLSRYLQLLTIFLLSEYK